jgi:hypothetical protein
MKSLEITRTARQLFSIFSLTDGRRVIFIAPSLSIRYCLQFSSSFFGLGFSVFSLVLAAVASKLQSGVKRRGPSFLSCFPGCFSWLGKISQVGEVCLYQDSTGDVPDLTEAVSASAKNGPRITHGPVSFGAKLLKKRFSGSGSPYAYDLRELWSTENSCTFASLCGKQPSDVGSVDGCLWMILVFVRNS